MRHFFLFFFCFTGIVFFPFYLSAECQPFSCPDDYQSGGTYWHVSCYACDDEADCQASCTSGYCPGDDYPVCASNPGYYICWHNDYSTSDQYFYYFCQGAACPDSDSDGLCDDDDPCPDNPDCDGDGIPDGEDPDPTDPDNPPPPDDPPPDPPDDPGLPDDLQIGDCVVNITELKQWLQGSDSFPFNWAYALYDALAPFYTFSPSPPVMDFEIALISSRWSYIPDSIPVHVDFGPYDNYARVLRWVQIILLAVVFVKFAIRKYNSFHGAQ